MLIDNHYDFSWTLQPQHLLDTGDGRPAGDGSYAKPSTSLSPHEGTVYVVAGSSSRVSSNGTLDHPVMYQSLRMAGSLVIDVDGDRLDGTFIDDTGQVGDRFTIEKGLVRPLQRDVPCLSVATGGTQNLQLHAGQQHAGRLYLLAGSLAPEPGFVVGGVSVPLTPGPWLTGSLVGVNGPLYPGSLGLLDSSGQGATAFVLPPGAGANLVGMSLYHAYIVFDQGGVYMASNAVRVRLEP